ncbi:MAG: hypothetical protein AB7S26_09030 [Sandaracinaceae bacterium]
MTADVQALPKQEGPPKRRLRNFLLDTRFQLKYTGAVVLVTIVSAVAVTGLVGGWAGQKAYEFSRGQSEMLTMQAGGAMEVSDELQQFLEEEARQRDEEVKHQIVVTIATMVVVVSVALTFILGLTGIVITHKIVGPAYKLKLLLSDVASGRLNIKGGLRKGDELQDVGDAFKSMVTALRERRREELAQLDEALEIAKEHDSESDVVEKLSALRDRLQATLDG